ncbi:MAG: hypothetical protein LBS10_03145 [Gracilibacteraceae bacterium]|jgi:trigger factor|nr:hypothetical protein [Gracilibacteraceae bacterium]
MSKFNLQINQTRLAGERVRLFITVPGDITADIAKGGLLAYALQNKLDLTNVEAADLERFVLKEAGEVKYQAFLDEYVMKALTPFAVEESGLEIILDPVATTRESVRAGQSFRYEATVKLKPRYELSSYDPVKVRLPRPSVTEAEVEEQLQAFLQRSAKSTAEAGAVVQNGDDVLFRIETVRKDTAEQVAAMTAARRFYTLGEGFLPPAFDAGLLGAQAGEERAIEFELPGMVMPDGSSGPGVMVAAKVTLLEVSRKAAPELTDEWVARNVPEAGTVAELRARVREAGLRHKESRQLDSKYFLTASALTDRFTGKIADDIYEATQVELLANLRRQCDTAGITMQDFFKQRGIPEQQFSMQVMLETRERLRQSFSLDALARHLGLSVDAADIQAALTRMAPGNEEKARQEFEGAGRGYQLREAALRTKANAWLVETAEYEYI